MFKSVTVKTYKSVKPLDDAHLLKHQHRIIKKKIKKMKEEKWALKKTTYNSVNIFTSLTTTFALLVFKIMEVEVRAV